MDPGPGTDLATLENTYLASHSKNSLKIHTALKKYADTAPANENNVDLEHKLITALERRAHTTPSVGTNDDYYSHLKDQLKESIFTGKLKVAGLENSSDIDKLPMTLV